MKSTDFFARHPVFTRDEYAVSREEKPDRSPRTVDSLLRKHCAAGRIHLVRRGVYATVPPGTSPDSLQVDPYLIATALADDATVSHHAALQFHGRTYSIWNQVTFLTRRHTRPFRHGVVEFVPVKPAAAVADLPDMGGGIVATPHAGGRVRVATCERAMVDVLHSPELGGGWEEIWRSLEMVEFFDLDAIITYTAALDSALTAARVGFFLEQHREELFVEERHLEALEHHRPAQTRYFDPTREPGELVKRWRLIVPNRVVAQTWGEVA